MIGEEYVVKVTANTSPMKKEIRKLRKEINKSFNIQSSKQDIKALEDAFESFNSAVIAGTGDMSKEVEKINTAVKSTFKSLKDINKETKEVFNFGMDSLDTRPVKTQLKELRQEYSKLLKSQDYKDYAKRDPTYAKFRKEQFENTEKVLLSYRRKGLAYTTKQAVQARLIEKYTYETFKKSPLNDPQAYYNFDKYQQLKSRYDKQLKEYTDLYSNQPTKYQLMERQKELQAKANPTDDWNKTLMAGRDKQTGEPFVPESVRKAREELAEVNKALDDRIQKEKEILDTKAKLSEYNANEMELYSNMEKDHDAYMKEINKNVKEIPEKASGVKGVFQTLAKPFQALAKPFKQIWSTIKSMGKRLLVFGIFRNFSQWIKEGTQNLYEWSKNNKKEWAEIFDKSKSLSTALGNAFALVKTYATMWFEKLGNSFKEVLIDLLNVISKAIAFATGEKTYIQANKDIMVRWSDNNAETRQLIQGFDDLNIWKGNDNTLPKDMFTEYEFSDYNTVNIASIIIDFFKGPFWGFVKTSFLAVWDIIKTGFLASIAPITMLIQDICTFWKNILWPNIKLWWNGITTEDEGDNGETITRQVEPGFKHALKEWFSNAWTTVKQWLVGDKNTGAEGVWQKYIKPAFDSLWQTFSAWMENTFVPLIAKIWENSGIKRAIDTEKDTLGDIGYSIANVLPWNWWKIQNGERPLVRPNAKGGVYTTPTLGLVGEASTKSNPELITPQSLLDDRINEGNRNLLSSISQIAGQIIEAINGVDMSVSIGDEVIARSAARGNNAYYKMMGRPLIR